MKIFLLILSIALCGGANASYLGSFPGSTTLGTNPALTQTVPAPYSSTFSLYSGDIGATLTATNYYPFYRDGAAYHTGTKKAYCYNRTDISQSINAYYQVISATASFAFNAAAITGGKYQNGAAAKYSTLMPTALYRTWSGQYVFGDGSTDTYAGIQSGTSLTLVVTLDCYEI